jgi:hypothetical protein
LETNTADFADRVWKVGFGKFDSVTNRNGVENMIQNLKRIIRKLWRTVRRKL